MPTPLALATLLLYLHAVAGFQAVRNSSLSLRSRRALVSSETLGCLSEGRWHREGAVLEPAESCLRCACARGALSCRRRACAALPDPPPARCHVLHRRGACCPELHCPDGIMLMEQSASARFESEEDIVTPSSVLHACVEGGTVYAAGSAMASHTACEQCFCLAGARRCVRPRCLAAPAACRARPAPGACCPHRYYCHHTKHAHDCEVNGEVIPEGERVVSSEAGSNCTRCFCLQGAVRCQEPACSAPLHGCRPLLRAGECCPHQYQCPHTQEMSHSPWMSSNALVPSKNEDRSFHKSKAVKSETSTQTILENVTTTSHIASTKKDSVETTKVKRKTDEQNVATTRHKQTTNFDETLSTKKLHITESVIPDEVTSTESVFVTELVIADEVTLQPESSVKVVINGTINCTAELSSTSIPLNFTKHEIDRIKMEAMPRVPLIDASVESQTIYPNDIITDRSVNGNFDENETFTINVTSSLNTNKNTSGSNKPSISSLFRVSPAGTVVTSATNNNSKKDYDYDYNEPTLPPSLPNLKIIPFVAADAVVDKLTSKKPQFDTAMDRDDKYPIYYPTMQTKETTFGTRRHDVYVAPQSPTYTSDKVDNKQTQSDVNNDDFKTLNDLLAHREYTVSTSFGRKPDIAKPNLVNKSKTSSNLDAEIPEVNRFSPPVETEGGFIPKGPGIIDEYYAVYPSTPHGPLVPHLTTSMQLDVSSGECTTVDGRRIPEGQSINVACSVCACAWGELHCSPRPCLTPPGCKRKPAASSTADLCCGELVCDKGEKTTAKPKILPTTKTVTEAITEIAKTKEQSNVTTEATVSKLTTPSILNSNASQIKDTLNTSTTISTLTKVETSTSKNFNNFTIKPAPVPFTLTFAATTETAETHQVHNVENETETMSHEYEDDEEEEDEGFSFGSVLKLLLSDTYDATTAAPQRKVTTIRSAPLTTKISNTPTTAPEIRTMTTTNSPNSKPPISFVPMPHHSYMPIKKVVSQNAVDRIDHLVLGEATAINKAPPRPITNNFKPLPPRPVITTKRPVITTRPITRPTTPSTTVFITTPAQVTRNPGQEYRRPVVSSGLPGVGGGLLKLAGCNIYGRMYRVGRIIAELSTPCSECWCSEVGVQCRPLNC